MHRETLHTLSRRDLLKATAAGALLAGISRSGFAKDKAAQAQVIALQLYSVRDDCGKDFDAALDEVAQMGFKAVEFAGYHKYGGNAKGLRKRWTIWG